MWVEQGTVGMRRKKRLEDMATEIKLPLRLRKNNTNYKIREKIANFWERR